MSIKYKLIFSVIFCLLVAGQLNAQILGAAKKNDGQESIFPDFSRVYLQKLQDTAEKYYPQLKIRIEQTKIATTTWRQSKAAFWDAFSITPSYVYNPSNSINLFNSTGASTNFFSGYQIAFSLSLNSFITRPYMTKNAKQAIKVAEYEEESAKMTLRNQIGHYYILYLQAQANLRLAGKSTDDIQLYTKQVIHDFQAGTVTLAVYTSALNAFNAQNVVKITAESATLDARNSLELYVGKRLEDIK